VKFEKKLNKIKAGSMKFDRDEPIVVGEEGATLDEIEQSIF
jgi:hypothetical protein